MSAPQMASEQSVDGGTSAPLADLKPNAADMRGHLAFLFSNIPPEYQDGMIELGWTTPSADHDLNRAKLYPLDRIDALVADACIHNGAARGSNVYVGAQLRKPSALMAKRTSDHDVYCSTCAYADFDAPGTSENAKHLWDQLPPRLLVITGNHPHERSHAYWRLTTPIADTRRAPAVIASMADTMNGDPKVKNSSRVLRLAGSVAWPVKTGRIAEMTNVGAIDAPGPETVTIGQLETAFPKVASATPPAANDNIPQPSGKPGLSLQFSRTDKELEKLLQASGVEGEWHDAMLKAVASMVGREWPDSAIRLACAPYCRGGADDSDLTPIINGGRLKWDKPNIERGGALLQPGGSYLNIRSAAAFASEYTPADYLVDGLLQTGFLYSLTAQTGVGKTAWALLLSQCTADGVPFAGREVQPGAVIYCAGENPEELRQRFLAMCDDMGRDAASFNIHFLTPKTGLGLLVGFDEVEAYAKSIGGGVRGVIVDTAAAFYDREDENSNTELGDYARRLRRLSELPGRPAIVVPCHPIKNPKTREECVPRGGGAFVNEVDGNLILWPTGDDTVELSWVRKFRGPQFSPMQFKLQQVETKTVVDAKGRPVRSVLARAVDEQEVIAQQGAAQDELTLMLVTMLNNPGTTTPTGLARECGWLSNVGTEPAKAGDAKRVRAGRRLKELKDMRLVERAAIGGAWRLTSKGKTEATRITKGAPDEPT